MNVVGFMLILFVGGFIISVAVSLIRDLIAKKKTKPPNDK